ncbi:protein of unknown function (DUF4470) [Carpediemonas membranifera]|uniref:DUF4470 domain-containing protein n=1 Tax=Carpediemonas membranifera TaxID=201153 RepID=A0A8J6EA16_9EUKA|nr:protein of unknown function (DUF4470) [Carpediemonas membranifera]|eukprot:KAG9394105.1 protein of unknown function (DUF4470) [Carpediemonas membranifera]
MATIPVSRYTVPFGTQHRPKFFFPYANCPPSNMLAYITPKIEKEQKASVLQMLSLDLSTIFHTISSMRSRTIRELDAHMQFDDTFHAAKSVLILYMLSEQKGKQSTEDVAFFFRLWYCRLISHEHLIRLRDTCTELSKMKLDQFRQKEAGTLVHFGSDSLWSELQAHWTRWAEVDASVDAEDGLNDIADEQAECIPPDMYEAIDVHEVYEEVGRIEEEFATDHYAEPYQGALVAFIHDNTASQTVPPEVALPIALPEWEMTNPAYVPEGHFVAPNAQPTRSFSFAGVTWGEYTSATALVKRMVATFRKRLISFSIAAMRKAVSVTIHCSDALTFYKQPFREKFDYVELGGFVECHGLLPATLIVARLMNRSAGFARAIVPECLADVDMLTGRDSLGVKPEHHHTLLGVHFPHEQAYTAVCMDATPKLEDGHQIALFMRPTRKTTVPFDVGAEPLSREVCSLAQACVRLAVVDADERMLPTDGPGLGCLAHILANGVAMGRLTMPDGRLVAQLRAAGAVDAARLVAAVFMPGLHPPLTPVMIRIPDADRLPLLAAERPMLGVVTGFTQPLRQIDMMDQTPYLMSDLISLDSQFKDDDHISLTMLVPIGKECFNAEPSLTFTVGFTGSEGNALIIDNWRGPGPETEAAQDLVPSVLSFSRTHQAVCTEHETRLTLAVSLQPQVTGFKVDQRGGGAVNRISVELTGADKYKHTLNAVLPYPVDQTTVKGVISTKKHSLTITANRAMSPPAMPRFDYGDMIPLTQSRETMFNNRWERPRTVPESIYEQARQYLGEVQASSYTPLGNQIREQPTLYRINAPTLGMGHSTQLVGFILVTKKLESPEGVPVYDTMFATSYSAKSQWNTGVVDPSVLIERIRTTTHAALLGTDVVPQEVVKHIDVILNMLADGMRGAPADNLGSSGKALGVRRALVPAVQCWCGITMGERKIGSLDVSDHSAVVKALVNAGAGVAKN